MTNQELTLEDFAPDLSTKGCFPKAWVGKENGFLLLKDGGAEVVKKEALASAICQCFDIPHVKYWLDYFEGELVSVCKLITSKKYSIVPTKAYEIYTINQDEDVFEACASLDPITYYGMNVLDYLIGNTDRHMEN